MRATSRLGVLLVTLAAFTAADAGDRRARQAVPLLEEPPGGDLWALRPAAEQLDSIAG
ncbi:hypothetical protein [Streptomyces sp. NPDC046859]|uniref:hypothetical protein n=1 Tax=Streptomyces sp. NPDC046859 TaxID=3155734 RepID=UPI0033F4A163